ncbi:MAG TPA: DUF2637 domain-containing protein [Streptomyces sp.]|uniref:DUF2637 domain-containing protein n=1 Tax=Streptomyces sp. TaxID=1931 RepID=UPI002D066B6C|nr:DUF2637 domain-containing protein [Streptomyces sp.]HWU12107.1 DUF2637 domain-containing protein [Streptomyces sp.]
MTTAELTAEQVQEQARQAYRESIEQGAPLTREELGEMFGRSASWGRDRIREARAELDQAQIVRPLEAEDPKSSDDDLGHVHVGVAPVDKPASATGATGDNAAVVARTATTVGQSPTVGARIVAWLGFAFGSVVSVAANWLAAWLPASDMPEGWSPTIAAQVGAAVWPVALLLSVEVLSRTAWQDGRAWLVVRLGGSAVVALGSAVISYGHVRAVLLDWGYDHLGASVGPLVIDGLMVLCGFALLSMSRREARPSQSVRSD